MKRKKNIRYSAEHLEGKKYPEVVARKKWAAEA